LLRQSYEKVSAKMKKGLGKPEDPSDIDPEQTAKLIKVVYSPFI
jgi:hypothetical protein